MGTELLLNPTAISPRPSPRKPTGLLVAAASLLVLFALKWSDLIEYMKDGQLRLQPKYERGFGRKENAPDEAIQYALLASEDGWYPFLHGGHVTLKKNLTK